MNKVDEMNGLTCLGAGTFPLDNLLMKHSDGSVETIYQHVGGTAGNVMSILAWMGWHTLPAARLDDSEVGLQLKADLESYDVILVVSPILQTVAPPSSTSSTRQDETVSLRPPTWLTLPVEDASSTTASGR